MVHENIKYILKGILTASTSAFAFVGGNINEAVSGEVANHKFFLNEETTYL